MARRPEKSGGSCSCSSCGSLTSHASMNRRWQCVYVPLVLACFCLSAVKVNAQVVHIGYFGDEEGILTREFWSVFGVAVTEANRTAPAGISYTISRVWTTSTNATNCSASAEQLVNSNVHVVVSTANSFCTANALPRFEPYNIAVLAAVATANPTLEQAPSRRVLFQLSPSDRTQGQALAATLQFFNWTSMSYVSVSSVSSSGIVEGVRDATQGLTSDDGGVAFSTEELINTPTSNISEKLDEAYTKILESGTGINLLDISDIPTSRLAYRLIFPDLETRRITGVGWQWIASSQATLALQQSSNSEVVRLYMQGTLALVPPYANLTSSLWQNYSLILEEAGHLFASGLATCGVLPGSQNVNLPYRGQVVDAVLMIEQAVRSTAAIWANASAQNSTSQYRSDVYNQLLSINSSQTAITSSTGYQLYFTADRLPAMPRLELVTFDANSWLSIGSWSDSSGFVLHPSQQFLWPGFSLDMPSTLAPGFRPRFKVGFLYIADTGNELEDALGREYLSAFNVSILHNNQNTSGSVLLDPVPRGVNTDENCTATAEELASQVHVVIGDYRSNCSSRVAEVLTRVNTSIAQISYGATLETLSNSTLYPFFLRVVPPDLFQARALAELIQRFGWSKVAILYTEDNLYSEGLLKSFQDAANGTLLNSTVITGATSMSGNLSVAELQINDVLWQIMQNDTRVVLLLVYSGLAERIVVQGSQENGPRPADGWIWVGTDSSTAFQPNSGTVDAVMGMVGTRPKGGQGFVYLGLLSEWLQLNSTLNPGTVFEISAQPQPFVPELFDAVSAAELALSDLVESKKVTQLSTTAQVRTKLFRQLLTYNSPENGFFGSIGSNIYFNNQGNGPAEYDIVNFQGGQWRTVGDWSNSSQDGMKLNLQLLTVLPGGEVALEKAQPPIFQVLYVGVAESSNDSFTKQLDLVQHIANQYVQNNRNFSIRLNINTFIPSVPSKCGSEVVTELERFENQTNQLGYVAVIGLLQSACAISTSDAFRNKNIDIPLISFGATSVALSNKTAYPNFFRTCPNDNNQGNVARDIVGHYGWTKIGIIGTTDPYGSGLAEAVRTEILRRFGDKVQPMKPILFEPNSNLATVQEKLNELRKGNTAVNYISAFTGDTRTVLKAAEHANMLSTGWTWLGGDGMTALQFDSNSQVQVQSLVGSSLIVGNGTLFEFLSTRYSNQGPALGLMPTNNVVFPNGRSVSVPLFAAQLFDSITLLSHSLSQLWNNSEIRNIQFTSTVTGRSSWVTETRRSIIKRLKNSTHPPEISGAIGLPVTFDANQDGPAAYNVLNYFGSQWQVVGEHVITKPIAEKNSSLILLRDIVWSGGVIMAHGSDPPTDNVSSNKRNETIAFVVIGVVLAVGVGLLLCHAVRQTRGTQGG